MTFSIVAWDPITKMTGVAVATKHLAVGSTVPHARSKVGSIATQAQTNPLLAHQALDILETQGHLNIKDSLAPEHVIEMVLAADCDRHKRQLHLVDAHGRTAAWTGAECMGWAGHKTFQYFSVAGNLLTGEQVLIDMAEAYMQLGHLPFAQRLLLSVKAGQAAGGDRRGQQSASIFITHNERYPYLDLRVDHHPNPLEQLSIILDEAHQDYYQSFLQAMPQSDILHTSKTQSPIPVFQNSASATVEVPIAETND